MKKMIFALFLELLSNHVFARATNLMISDNLMSGVLTMYGASYDLNNKILNITINQSNLMAHVDEQMQLGVFSSWVTPELLSQHPLLHVLIAENRVIPFIIARIYHDNNKLNNITVHVYREHYNSYGNPDSESIASFNMSKKLNDLISWDNMSRIDIPNIMPGFQFSNFTYREAHKEHISLTT